MSLPRIRLDFGLSKLLPGAEKPQAVPSGAIAFPLAGAPPFDGYPGHISETAPASLPGWTVSALYRRIPADLAALLSADPASPMTTVTALVDRLDYYRARMAEYQERLSAGAKGNASIENYIRLVYIQLFNELATAFRLDLTQENIADVRAQAFVRVIRQVKLLTTADLIKVADLIHDEVLNAIIARSDWIRRGEDGPVAAPQSPAPIAAVPARPVAPAPVAVPAAAQKPAPRRRSRPRPPHRQPRPPQPLRPCPLRSRRAMPWSGWKSSPALPR